MNSLLPFFDKIPTTSIKMGTPLQSIGNQCEHFLLVISGTIRVYTISVDGRDKTIYKIKENGVCITTTSCLLSDRAFPVIAEAQTDTKVKLMPKKQFKLLLETSRVFQTCILTILSNKIGSLLDTISMLNTFSVEARLHKWLVNQNQKIIQITHSEIANDIGSSREVVSRHLKLLEQQQVISMQRGELIIKELANLKNMI